MTTRAKSRVRFSLLFFLLSLIVAPTIHAYLDPATGSYVFQALIAAVVTVSFAVKSYWHKIKGIFGSSTEPTQPAKSDSPKTE